MSSSEAGGFRPRLEKTRRWKMTGDKDGGPE
jgi:hypothetical protein